MAPEVIDDKLGNEIYLTDERWEHIVETHEEMLGLSRSYFCNRARWTTPPGRLRPKQVQIH
jgi:hypothetical protein